ncbi:MAG: SMI1/KNR4 family protein [Flavobacteriaceae bacterium]|jgi:cell wall assembly regulator SMI1|nr:SMI1/KNR4 family protein [Flavobacteriaceae bacterium]
MIRFDFTSNGFEINGVKYSFPIAKEELFNLFGEAETFVGPHNEVYIWHTLGLRAFAKDGALVDTIEVTYIVEDYSSAAKHPFVGQLCLNGETDPMLYYNNHKKERIKLWDSDDTGAFVFEDATVWYNIREEGLTSLSLQAFEEPIEEQVDVLPFDENFEYLEVVWKEWKVAIENKVGADNKYYNPTHGITQEQLDTVIEQLEEVEVTLPAILVNFYKGGNVKWNAVTSAISLQANGWNYDLLPFENIVSEWENINDLFDEDEEVDEELIANFDSRLKCTSYANPNWIPIAEGKNGDYLLIDTDPSDTGTYGQIIELQNESWERTVVAFCLEELIYREIASLEGETTEHQQFIIDNGTF